jgi:phosphatidylserine/phosphatidylglycerophosphate/cardiolipin synthase-like enzyme/membrane protein DedA with SNARE-associated domain
MSMLLEGKNCWRRVRADRAAFVVDGAAYFDAFARAALRAQRSILIVGWDFNSRARLWYDEAPPGVPPILGDFLDFLVKRKRGLQIHILDWDFPMIYAMDRETPPIFGLGWQPRRHIHLRFDRNFPTGGSQHQKVIVIDDAVAFSGGMDLAADRWDTPQHQADDPRRLRGDMPYPPVHDVMIAVDGDAARALGDLARERWRRATGEKLAPVRNGGDPWPDELVPDLSHVAVAVSRTEPAYDGRSEVREVETLYVDMLASAKRLIYIENQYFTSSRIGAALEERLRSEDCPEIVIVLRRSSDGWLEGPTMGTLRAQLLASLRRADRFGRLQVYYPVVPDLGNRSINVHAKLCIVDDELARVGSANLNNRSMGFDTECDLTVEAEGSDATGCAIAGFRNRLLAEHLDASAAEVAAAFEREGSAVAAISALAHGERRLVPLAQSDEWPVSLAPIAELADLESPVAAEQLITQFAPDGTAARSGHPLAGWLLALLVLAGLFAAWRWTPLSEYMTPEAVNTWATLLVNEPAGPFFVIAAYTLATLTMFPRPLITLAAVLAYGPLLGFAYAMTGMLAAALLTYSAGRWLSRDLIRRVAGRRLNRLSRELRRRGLLSVIAVRLVPVAPFIVVNMVAGAAHIRVSHYVLGTAIGILPGTLVATVFGGQLHSALRDPGDINYGLIAISVGAVVLAFFALRRWLRRRIAADGKALADAS